jgi:hypothetical protein
MATECISPVRILTDSGYQSVDTFTNNGQPFAAEILNPNLNLEGEGATVLLWGGQDRAGVVDKAAHFFDPQLGVERVVVGHYPDKGFIWGQLPAFNSIINMFIEDANEQDRKPFIVGHSLGGAVIMRSVIALGGLETGAFSLAMHPILTAANAGAFPGRNPLTWQPSDLMPALNRLGIVSRVAREFLIRIAQGPVHCATGNQGEVLASVFRRFESYKLWEWHASAQIRRSIDVATMQTINPLEFNGVITGSPDDKIARPTDELKALFLQGVTHTGHTIVINTTDLTSKDQLKHNPDNWGEVLRKSRSEALKLNVDNA